MSGKSPTKKRWLLICQAKNTPAPLQVFNYGFLGRNITPLPIEHANCLFDGKFARHEFFLNVIW
jgi:hypothetical protein